MGLNPDYKLENQAYLCIHQFWLNIESWKYAFQN